MADDARGSQMPDRLLRAHFSRQPVAAPGPYFASRVMANVAELAAQKRDQAYFLRVAARIVLAGGCLAAIFCAVALYGYAKLNLASLAQAFSGAAQSGYLSL